MAKITSIKNVAVLHPSERWEGIRMKLNKQLKHGLPITKELAKGQLSICEYLDTYYRLSLTNQAKNCELLTSPVYLISSLLFQDDLQEVIDRYRTAHDTIGEHIPGFLLLKKLYQVLKRISYILEYDRNQAVAQILSFNAKKDSLIFSFCDQLGKSFPYLPWQPLPSDGFYGRLCLKSTLAGRKELSRLTGHKESVQVIGLFCRKRCVISCSNARFLIWDKESGNLLKQIIVPGQLEITALVVIEQEHTLAACFREGIAKVWEWTVKNDDIYNITLTEKNTYAGERAFLDIKYIGDNKLVLASTSGKITIWNYVNNGLKSFDSGINSLHAICIMPNGDIAVGGGNQMAPANKNLFKIFDKETYQEKYCSPEHEWPVNEIKVIDNNRVVSRANESIYVIDIGKNQLFSKKTYASTLHTLFAESSSKKIFYSRNNEIYVLDKITDKEIKIVTSHHGMISDIIIDREGNDIITSSMDQTIRIWDYNKLVYQRESGLQHSDSIRQIIHEKKYNVFISCSEDGSIIIWDSNTGRALNKIKAHAHWVSGVCNVPDEGLFISYSWDGWVKFWHNKDYYLIRSILFEKKIITQLLYAPVNEMIVFTDFDGNLFTCNSRQGQLKEVQLPAKVVKLLPNDINSSLLILKDGHILLFNYSSSNYQSLIVPQYGAMTGKKAKIKPNRLADIFYVDKQLYISSTTGKLSVYDITSGTTKKVYAFKCGITGMIFFGSRKKCITISGVPHFYSDNTIRICDFNTKKILSQFTIDSPLRSAAYSERSNLLCAGDDAGGIYFFRLNTHLN